MAPPEESPPCHLLRMPYDILILILAEVSDYLTSTSLSLSSADTTSTARPTRSNSRVQDVRTALGACISIGVQPHHGHDWPEPERVGVEGSRICCGIALPAAPRNPLAVWPRRQAEVHRGSGCRNIDCGHPSKPVVVLQVSTQVSRSTSH